MRRLLPLIFCGAGAAFDFGFLLLETLSGDKTAAEELKKTMLYKK